MFKFLVTLISITSLGAFAGEPIKIGISGNVEADGFFSPTLTSYTIESVKPNSPAEKAGIVAGQKIISVEDCKIPGCEASEAKKLMRKESGEVLHLLLENTDGSKVPVKITLSAW
ncbi:PDZ domain-containing protein [Colwellia sp. MB3u-4]|uniref:PDZ domain-containing protein n=1 Tax=Colwellia sp. MB3u-4 TaxID=2759822 RepID=UPI0015F3C966|nr:PDZ domain-containing protein [Colwellia sp. MB3u-4]MBA6290002.1 PDZ domain-containing protein [Colwellia sp. MB3u-4]